MQTFMPYIHVRESLESIDNQRLNKQILEASQIIQCIDDPDRGYQSHPAVRMWRGHILALCNYGAIAADVFAERFCKADDRSVWFARRQTELRSKYPIEQGKYPPWFGCIAVHASHRSRLIVKNPDRYGPEWPDTPEDMPYLWPVNTGPDTFYLKLARVDYRRLETGERKLPDWIHVSDSGEVIAEED
jgi:hypothetical protein